ncbi:MAG: FtsX-like permease family protein [Microcystis sp. Msp_OC_L_20101000_S702]|jgi:putative ABC transport system permease protein|uniref:ABC transporter permease n=1 Tax=Microcystis sp. Msp_OC_L_20101000_S702 TaxID=2486218 RepID=UPI00119081F5|nr:ABC transporter permease [Microcystis sp. Msp_OC_L_20101000_S702]TRU04213.1 MAG: FtsX-like permease family protein [Microcystis sp. Msp_OC_L_20101000_S702]
MEMLENLKMAFSALMANKLRSSLTMLGIAIGNASVIALVGVGEGAQKVALEQFEALGPNVLFVSTSSRNVRRTIPNPRPLTYEDAQAIASQVPAIAAISPELSGKTILSFGNRTSNSPLVGVGAEYLNVRNRQLSKGRFIMESDLKRDNRVIVLGSELAKNLFGNRNPVGENLRIGNLSFQVIGVLQAKGSLFEANQDDRALIPLTTMSNRVQGRRSIFGIPLTHISVLAKNSSQIKAAQFQISNLLQMRHQVSDENYVQIFPQTAVLEMTKETNDSLTRMLASIASISLFVGGIGVMNIMLVSVTERTQEIGLRKALGAKEGDIKGQFLIESVILATTGGIIGIFVGIQGMYLAGIFAALTTSVSIPAIILALGVSSAIGLIFGVVPAHRAAKLEPIVALRRL